MERPDAGPVSRRGDRPVLRLRLQPRSSRKGVIGLQGGRVRFAVNAPPVDGAANRELVKALGRILGVPPSRLGIVAGERSRDKDILIDCPLSDGEILKRMGIEENA